MNSRSANRITGLRPHVSARRPDVGLASSAKRAVTEVRRDLSRVVRGWEDRSVPMETRVQPIQASPCAQDLRCITLHTFEFNRFTTMLLSPLGFPSR